MDFEAERILQILQADTEIWQMKATYFGDFKTVTFLELQWSVD